MDIYEAIYYDTKEPSMVNKQIVVDNLLLSYTVFPQEAEPSKHAPFLFLHGWRSSKEIWQPLLPYLPHDVPQYFLDLPGFGASDTPPSAFTLDDYCAVVVGFIQKLGLPQLTLIGHSFGGRIAIKLATTQPEWVSHLVLIDSAGIPLPSKTGGAKKVIAKMVKPFFKPHFMQPLRRKIYTLLGAEDYVATPELTTTFRSIVREDVTPYLSKIRQPTLIVWGEKDTETPVSFAHTMKDRIPHSELVIIPSAGHFSFVDAPQTVGKHINQFLDNSYVPS